MHKSEGNSYVEKIQNEFNKLIGEMQDDYAQSYHSLRNDVHLLNTQEKLADNYKSINALADKISRPLGTAVLSLSSANDKVDEVLSTDKCNIEQHLMRVLHLQEELQIAHQKLLDINNIIEQINDLKPESKVVNVTCFSLKKAVENVIQHTACIIQSHNVVIKTNVKEKYLIETCESVFQRVLIGLIYNLCLFGGESNDKSEITIQVQPACKQNRLIVFVEDTRKPLSQDILKKAFSPLLTLDSTDSFMGFGLVAISNLVLNTLQGSIDVDVDATGINFKVELPINHMSSIDCKMCTVNCHKY